jgi:cytochrome c2
VNGVGPHLVGVVGREIAGLGSYSYSDALASKDWVWNLENLMAWLENPGEFAAGNKMGYALRDAQQRIDVITYLNEADGSPEPLQ